MSFNAQITFTGICTFVPNQDGSRYYAFMPNGEQELGPVPGPHQSIDGTVWRRHRGFLRFSVKDLAYAHGVPMVPDGVSGVLYFQRNEAEGGGEGETGTELVLRCPGAPDLTVDEKMPIADLSVFAPDFSTIDSDLITKPTAKMPDTIAMRMLIERGTLTHGKIAGEWRIPNTLNTAVDVNDPILLPQDLVHDVVLDLHSLHSLQFIANPIPGGSTRVLDLSAPDDGTVYVTIANLCDDNPLQWPPAHTIPRQPDVDFKWHYRLLDKDTRETLKNLLSGLELPFPLVSGDPNDSGGNCYLCRAKTSENF